MVFPSFPESSADHTVHMPNQAAYITMSRRYLVMSYDKQHSPFLIRRSAIKLTGFSAKANSGNCLLEKLAVTVCFPSALPASPEMRP